MGDPRGGRTPDLLNALQGIAIGILLAALGSQVLRKAIFGLGALDPVTFLGVTLLLLAVSALACWLPARRAAQVDPIEALRTE